MRDIERELKLSGICRFQTFSDPFIKDLWDQMIHKWYTLSESFCNAYWTTRTVNGEPAPCFVPQLVFKNVGV